MGQPISSKKYGPHSRIFVALLIAFGSCALVGYGNFLDWLFALILAISIIFEDEKWAEFTCWAAIIGKIGGAFAAFQNINLSVGNLFVFGSFNKLDAYINDPLVVDVLGDAIQTAKLVYDALIVAVGVAALYALCLDVLYILIPCYLGRHYIGRGGIVFSTILLALSIVFSLLVIFLAIGCFYLLSILLSMTQDIGKDIGVSIGRHTLMIGVIFLFITVLRTICLPLGARLYFDQCRKHLKHERINSLKQAASENFQPYMPENSFSSESFHAEWQYNGIRYCSHCGKEIMPEAVICPYCGCPAESNQPNQKHDEPSTGLNVLSFLIPLAGLIIYLMDKDKMPRRASAAGKWALTNVVVCVGLLALCTIFVGIYVASRY